MEEQILEPTSRLPFEEESDGEQSAGIYHEAVLPYTVQHMRQEGQLTHIK